MEYLTQLTEIRKELLEEVIPELSHKREEGRKRLSRQRGLHKKLYRERKSTVCLGTVSRL